ncbi:MAG TPA: DMT family transporter [Steroidobacteraceae bacterium]|nr:DMT family transporter [Steroidobacteraceae bacterium]
MKGLAYVLGITAGFGLALQVGMNAQLRKVLQSANAAALISFLVGTAALLALLLVTRVALPTRDSIAAVPAWAWFGGLFGAFYVAISTIVASELGAASLLALALVGQLTMALVVDHFGWLGLPVNPITFTRLAGVALLGIGVWLVTR